ncbi:pantetheine-phosphate adenylyltransferase [Terasakiella sp. A23]|uniref:pantetheine-phosphate adenylyltransferase n=1 Tax=Terasakiella sp. FCG-A23 TaxID=3080561 RepID=UPI002955A791|nr:pantetheine-phosphate adenylyltransferase [Terasakiella sp. A23]MDV7339393.1 pantetheine-phosphate adenylyltransferase [Terasakiella sp. A23]
MPKNRIGVYPGTFDPVTNGHLDIIERGAHLVDHLILAVAINEGKGPLFSLEERVAMVEHELPAIMERTGATIEVKPFQNLLMNFAAEQGAKTIIRGLRAVSDFEYEFQMAGMNSHLAPDIETVFLMASDKCQFISSRFVKEIGKLGGDINDFVTPNVREKLKERFASEK